MKMQFHCIADCQMGMMLQLMQAHHVPAERQLELLREFVEATSQYAPDVEIDIAFSRMYIALRKKLEVDDFYLEAKRSQNAQAQALLPVARQLIEQEADQLLGALKISSSGNIIDITFGHEFDVESSLRESMHKDFAIDDYPLFVDKLRQVDDLLLATDNAGEIVFDRLLVEQIQRWRADQGLAPLDVTVLVKGGPVLNDATRADAETVGFQHIARVLDTGCEYIGLPIPELSRTALEALDHAGLILAKGQANYESASYSKRFADHIFHLFRAKCQLIWKHLSVPAQSPILLAGNRAE